MQNPTEGPNPALTPERMRADGLDENKEPDLLVENRIFDIYTPREDSAASIREGVKKKIDRKQTNRVVVDITDTTQTEATVRSALRANPVDGLREVLALTKDGLGRPFRP